MTDDEFSNGSKPVSEVGESGTILMEDSISSPWGSVQSLHSSQNSEREKVIPYVPPSKEKELQFNLQIITLRG